MTTYKELTEYLREMGIADVPHTRTNFLAHLVAVYHLMKRRGCDEEVSIAGMFHSIYGTERFQRFAMPTEQRDEIRTLIGERPEHLAYLNCAMDRATFDAALEQEAEPYRFRDRITGESVELDQADFDDLMRVHLYDWLEQVPRTQKWDYRRDAYRQMATRLGGPALELYDEVFAAESV